MELEGRPRPPAPLMLKEWLELESSAELSRDGFGCYPRHLPAELRSGSGRRRNGDVIRRVSAAMRAALFPPSGLDGEAALSRNFSRRLRVGFWKKWRGEGEEADRRVPSCSAATASGDGSSPAMSPRRRSWGRGQAGGGGVGTGGRQNHETEVVGCGTARHLNLEQEQKQRLSPVSVMDFLSQDEDDGEDEDGNVDSEDDGDDEIASPTFQRNLANIRRASQQLLQTIRQFEQLAELDTSDVDDATTATEDISCHMAETDSVEDSGGAPTQELLNLLEASSSGSTHCFQKLLEDFFSDTLPSCCGEKPNSPNRAKSFLEPAKAGLDGQDCSLPPDWTVEMTEEIEWLGRWRCLREDEQKQLAVDLEGDIFWSLVGEFVGELTLTADMKRGLLGTGGDTEIIGPKSFELELCYGLYH